MKRLISLAFLMTSSSVCADSEWVNQSVEWLKDALPQNTTVSFNKSRIKFNGCKHREYELLVSQPVTENFTVEAQITQAKGQLDWGLYKQSVRLEQFSIVPRYRVSERVSLGAGMVIQSSPEFRTSHGFDTDLPEGEILLLNSRIYGIQQDHQIEFEISRTRYAATSESGTWFERGEADNKVTLSYEVIF